MRFSKHVLPIAILLTGVIAAKDEESTTAVEKAKATEDKPSKTTADDSESNTAEATEEASETATGKDGKDKESKTDKSDTKTGTKDKETASKTSTSVDGPTITWDPPAPKTTVPDINAGSPSPMTPGVLVLSLVFGITSLGMALL